jgi:predicted nucleotidyltransferase
VSAVLSPTTALPAHSLRNDEQSALSKISGKNFVVRAGQIGLQRAPLDEIRAYFCEHADTIKRQVRDQGVLLFRGLPVSEPEATSSCSKP